MPWQPTRRGLLVLICGLVFAALPTLFHPSLWTLWGGFLALTAALFAFDALAIPSKSRLDISLEVPARMPMGQPSKLILKLTNPRRFQYALEALVDVSESLRPPPLTKLLLGAGPQQAEIEVEPARRGEACVEAYWVRLRGPLGLVLRQLRYEPLAATQAIPNIGGVRRRALRFYNRDEVKSGTKVERYLGAGSEFDSLKEFLPGQDNRHIDWKASARHNKLLTRHFRAERNHSVILAVDTGRLMAEELSGLPRLDHAIHAALLLSYFSARAGDRVSLFGFDVKPHTYFQAPPGVMGFRALLHASSDLRYSPHETNYTLGLVTLLSKLRRRSLVIVLTDFVDSIGAELMIKNLRRVASKHLVIFVAVRDPDLAAIRNRAPEQMKDVHRAVVAQSLLQERQLVIKRLKQHGIMCIDAAPEDLGIDLVNQYLKVKEREMIG